MFEFPKDGARYTGDPSHTNNPTNLFESLLQIPVLMESTCSPPFQSWVFDSYIHQMVCLCGRFLSIILRYRCILFPFGRGDLIVAGEGPIIGWLHRKSSSSVNPTASHS